MTRDSSAGPSPRSVSTFGWRPRASSRSSSSACASSSLAPTRISDARSGSVGSFDSASRSERERAARRCCAPSWRFRSRRRRARVGRGHDPAPGGSHLGLLPLALGDVGPRDEHPWRSPLVDDRRRGPGHRPLVAVPCQPPALPLRLSHAVRRARDRHPGGELVVAGDELEERCPFELLDRPAERLDEREVGAVRDDDRLVVGHDDEARDGVRHRAREVPLALQLDLAALAVGDVDPPRDDPDDVAVLVDQRGRLPRDRRAPVRGRW